MSKNSAALRQINLLIREVSMIEEACVDPRNKKKSKLDEFQNIKKDLVALLSVIKDDIKTHKGMQERLGRNQDEIRLKRVIEKNFEEVKKLQTKLDELYQGDQKRFDSKKKDALPEEEVEARKEIVQLLKQDIEYTESLFKPSSQQDSKGFQLARQARERRRTKREEGAMSSEVAPLTEKQQQFIQESLQKDQLLDEKLDQIKQQVMVLGQIGDDINVELKKQDIILTEVDDKISKITDKLKSKNQQMKELLDASGGAQRWCPVIFLLIVLLALCGYIYNLSNKSS